MLRLITAARSWHVLLRTGIATILVVAATALQWPIEVGIPGEPFLLNFIVVAIVSIFLGRTPGFLTVAGTSIASGLFFEPLYSFKVRHAIDLLAIEAYAVVAAASVEAFCRLVDGALTEKSEANSARSQQQEAQTRLSDVELLNRSLAESEQRLRATFENAAVGISHFSLDGRWFRVNEAMCRIMGWPADEIVTKSFQELTHPDDLAVEMAKFEQLRAGKIDSYSVDKRTVRKDGEIVWIRRTVSCVRKCDRSIDYLVSVVEDISAGKRAEEELRESERRFRSSLLHSPVPVMLFDDREDIVAVSQSWLDETGYSKEELCHMEDWTARAYPERSDEVLEDIRRTISRKPKTKRIEEMLRTKDDRERVWNFVTAPLGTLPNGRYLFISVAQDLTERKAHEQQVQLLMREAYHRIKNLLGLVEAIARQSIGNRPEEFIRRFTERIQALAANQDLLVRNQAQGVSLEDLVRAQLAHFADLVDSRITLGGPELRLNAAAAQAIGLALHELATNAGKYGALSTDAGQVEVGWHSEGDVFAMSWKERDGPPVRPPKRRGFGITVIDTMVKQALEGEVQLDYDPSGLAWRITCPAGKALELLV